MKIQLWSYNYDPEPTGIGVVSTVWARGLRDRGHEVAVIAAHPHYPEPRWGARVLPYREVRDGIATLRLPLWIGRASAAQRYRQELTFMAALAAATPFLSRPDVLVSASPSCLALLPAVVDIRARGIPWVLWLHDLLPDGATATGLVDDRSHVIELARRLERGAYRAADRIVVLSRAFSRRTSSPKACRPRRSSSSTTPRQGAHTASGARGRLRRAADPVDGEHRLLAGPHRAGARFESRPDLTAGALLVITGTGVAAEKARAEIRTRQVKMLRMVDDVSLEAELQGADVALVSQRYDGSELNIPSKLMSFLLMDCPFWQRSILAVSWRRSSVNPARAGSLTRATRTLFRVGRAARTWRFRNVRLACDDMFDQDAFANSFERTL